MSKIYLGHKDSQGNVVNDTLRTEIQPLLVKQDGSKISVSDNARFSVDNLGNVLIEESLSAPAPEEHLSYDFDATITKISANGTITSYQECTEEGKKWADLPGHSCPQPLGSQAWFVTEKFDALKAAIIAASKQDITIK